MESRFNAEFIIDYYGVDASLYATFPRLMAYMQETSVRHTDATPNPMRWYLENGFGFLLTNWHIDVYKYPYLGDKIKIYTWPTMFKGILCERCFEARSADGGLIAAAVSKWAFMDLNRRMASKPPAELTDGYGGTFSTDFVYDYNFSRDTYGYVKHKSETIKAARRDMDQNGHVNNVKYIEWITDCAPDDIYDAHCIEEAKVAYKKECKKGQKVVVETYIQRKNADDKTEILNFIKSDEPPHETLLEAYFNYRKK